MNTSYSQNHENLVQPDYYAQLWFEKGQLVAAVLQDDYTAWFDLNAGLEGSNLADANGRITMEEFKDLLSDWYLTEETAVLYYNVIETNDIGAAARAYPEFLRRGFRYIGIQDKHKTRLQTIKEMALRLYTEENGAPRDEEV